jgi:hypothetical protein
MKTDMETMEKEPKEKRECPLCRREMVFEPASHSSLAHAGGKGQFTPTPWECLCGHHEASLLRIA